MSAEAAAPTSAQGPAAADEPGRFAGVLGLVRELIDFRQGTRRDSPAAHPEKSTSPPAAAISAPTPRVRSRPPTPILPTCLLRNGSPARHVIRCGANSLTALFMDIMLPLPGLDP